MGWKSYIKDFIPLAFQLSMVVTMFAYGLRVSAFEPLYVVRQPRLLARSFAAVFVVAPATALVATMMFHVADPVRIAIIALSLSAVPPLLTEKEMRVGGDADYAVGLVVVCTVLSVVATPMLVLLLGLVDHRPFSMSPFRVSKVVFGLLFLPLMLGTMVHAFLRGGAERLRAPVLRVATILVWAAILLLVAGASPLVRPLLDAPTLLSLATFTAGVLVIGHLMGGPDASDSVVLATSCANRHPGLAFAITMYVLPAADFGAAFILCLVVRELVTRPYVVWMQRVLREHPTLEFFPRRRHASPLDEQPLHPSPASEYSPATIPPRREREMKPLHEQLADLSVRAKKAEDAFTAAKNETRDRILARREETRAAAVAAVNRVNHDLEAAGSTLEEQWNVLRNKVVADINRLKTNITERQVERNVHRLADRAARKESEAGVAIDFALASIEDAKLAVLDAMIANLEVHDETSNA